MSTFDPQALPRVGEVVGRYHVLSPIAQGGMAAVYAVRREGESGFEKLLAMKLILPHLAEDQHFLDMFMDEARIAAQIQHPNVVSVFDVGSHRGLPYLVMEFLKGQSLAAVLKRFSDDDFDTDLLLHILAEAAAGLHAAHSAAAVDGRPLGIVHRDVSPQNTFVGYDGTVRVVDFGVAAAVDRLSTTRTGEVKGKLGYIAPELLHRRFEVDRRADLWSFGVMAWQSLSGRKLFRVETEAETLWNVLNKPVPTPVGRKEPLPVDVVRVIMKCLERVPSDRPADARILTTVFRQAAKGSDLTERLARTMRDTFEEEARASVNKIQEGLRTKAPSETAPRRDRGSLWLAGGALAVVAAAGAVLAVTYGSDIGAAESQAAAQDELVGASPAGASARNQETETEGEAQDPRGFRPPEEATVTLSVDPSVRYVLVDDVLHAERPVALSLGDDEESSVLLVGVDGREETRRITRNDDGHELRLPPRRATADKQQKIPERIRRRERAPPRRQQDEASSSVMGRNGLLTVPLDLSM